MSPLFMETGYELTSPGSVSTEESITPGSERGETRKRGRKTEKNRDAARKSRKKQTERADELHEELQSLERSNSALKKEIAALNKDFNLYTKALECHKPCFIKDSLSGSTTDLSVPPSVACESTQLSFPSLPPPKSSSLASPSGSDTELYSSVSATCAASFSAVSAPHSLFSEVPPSLIASRPPKNAPPVCTSLVSNPVSSSSLTKPAQSVQVKIHRSSTKSATASFSMDEFLMKQASFLAPSSYVAPPNSQQGCPMNVDQLNTEQLSRNSSLPCSFLPQILEDPAPKSVSEWSPALGFSLKLSNNRQPTLNHASLLSRLTVPSPVYVPQTASSSFDIPHHPLSLPPLEDTPKDFTLSELLEGNEWILSGTSH
ncbi:hypothetical protein PBY51_006127 [Eleginops maclovinus]|uniref:BZIP domain-containing protein n=1 Tax=Eleginops maclovinus TaxID=56733 RepID=A0AAN7WTT5_ELEMC|nr:hypothetical protein PBY51_006127 [Eleginops maclovinus]